MLLWLEPAPTDAANRNGSSPWFGSLVLQWPKVVAKFSVLDSLHVSVSGASAKKGTLFLKSQVLLGKVNLRVAKKEQSCLPCRAPCLGRMQTGNLARACAQSKSC